ncbi:MAG TPA: hypothetical protein P5205_03735 [Candidatus Paceibacterota bacterium]|nr:hypothetical protein [Verrucomicrobiota bacterium]HSA09460.1 hypothetical protein [Candidatus Paceibacterota bacterium]
MKLRWVIGLGVLVLAAGATAYLLFPTNSAQQALESTRNELRRQGFKVGLSEFDLSASGDLLARASALTNAASAPVHGGRWYARNEILSHKGLNLMTPAGSNCAVVVWMQKTLALEPAAFFDRAGYEPTEDLWAALRQLLDESRPHQDAACAAALAGPIRFNLEASRGSAMLLPHAAVVKGLGQTFGTRAVLDLHDGNREAAWSNVVASARLVTAWQVEPVEVSHMVRFGCVSLAYDTAWQALQTPGWNDEHLAGLQHEWASLDLFKGLPETAAFSRAAAADLCQRERAEPIPSILDNTRMGFSLRLTWHVFVNRWRRVAYRGQGSYEDERAVLLHYRDRELELRQAVQCPSWIEMRRFPGVTNFVPFASKHASKMQTLQNLRQVSIAMLRGGQSLLGRAAEAEARRRLLVTAIALERYRARHGSHPQALQQLVPELLPQPPTDFMDGQPLRYQPTPDGHFVLYSVGLDCVDNGGEMRRPQWRGPGFPQGLHDVGAYGGPAGRGWGGAQGTDLVWPRPASPAEMLTHQQELERQAQASKAAFNQREADYERQAEAERQAAIAQLQAEVEARRNRSGRSADTQDAPTYHGQPLSKLLCNEEPGETTQPTLDELMTLRRVITADDPETVTFEVPIRYDVVTNIGSLRLLIDAGHGGGEMQVFERATNGNCLLVWNTTYDSPGRHFVQAQLFCTERQKERRSFETMGPPTPFFSSNLCQFDPLYSQFDSRGAILYAKLPESNGIYRIELTTPQGAHLKTFQGTTSNGVIKVHWDLTDGHGQRFTNTEFNSSFSVTLPSSGRSQEIKGP